MKKTFNHFNLYRFKTHLWLLCFVFLGILNQSKAQSGRVFNANGSTDYVLVPNNIALGITNNFTVEAWINPCNLTQQVILSKEWCAGAQNSYYLSINNGIVSWVWDADGYCGTAPSVYSTNTAVVVANGWTHVAVVHTSAAVSIYINGNLVPGTLAAGSVYSTIFTSTSTMRIGAYQGLNGNYGLFFNGGIDEVHLWNTVRTQAQIQAAMAPLIGNEANLVAYYNFEGAGANVPNIATSTGAALNGASVGTVHFTDLPITITGTSPVCAGATGIAYSVQNITNATYVWTLPTGASIATGSGTNAITVNFGSTTGDILVTQTDGCVKSTKTMNVVVNSNPVVSAITGNTSVCVNQYTPLSNTTTGGVWSSSNTAVATVNSYGLVQGVSAGTAVISYTVTSSGCSTVVTTTVTVNGTLVFVINGASTLCPNTTGNAYSVSPAVAGADYTWNIQNAPSVGVNFPVNGSTNTELSIPASLTGQFILRCQGLNACGASSIVSKTITINTNVPPSPDVTCSGTSGTNTCVNLVVSNYGTNTIEWIVGGVVQSTSPSFTRPLSTSVLCTYTSASGCKTSTWYSPAVTCTYAARLAQDIDLPVDKPFLIYPNPAKGVFVIQTKNQIGTASIYDVTGRLVKEIELSDHQNSYTVEIDTAGVYIIHVRTNTETKGYKIVIE
jgi:hypothetical protein